MSTTSIRIKDSVYSRLELNAKGYESVSDTINRANLSLEKDEAFSMLDEQVACSVRDLAAGGVAKEKTLLMHHQREAIQSAMDIVLRIYHDYKVNYEITNNVCCIKVVANSQLGNKVKASV